MHALDALSWTALALAGVALVAVTYLPRRWRRRPDPIPYDTARGSVRHYYNGRPR